MKPRATTQISPETAPEPTHTLSAKIEAELQKRRAERDKWWDCMPRQRGNVYKDKDDLRIEVADMWFAADLKVKALELARERLSNEAAEAALSAEDREQLARDAEMKARQEAIELRQREAHSARMALLAEQREAAEREIAYRREQENARMVAQYKANRLREKKTTLHQAEIMLLERPNQWRAIGERIERLKTDIAQLEAEQAEAK